MVFQIIAKPALPCRKIIARRTFLLRPTFGQTRRISSETRHGLLCVQNRTDMQPKFRAMLIGSTKAETRQKFVINPIAQFRLGRLRPTSCLARIRVGIIFGNDPCLLIGQLISLCRQRHRPPDPGKKYRLQARRQVPHHATASHSFPIGDARVLNRPAPAKAPPTKP